MCFFLSLSFVALAVCFGSLSCWNTLPRPIFNALVLTVHGIVHRSFDAVQLFCPLSITPPKHNVSTSMFDGEDGVLGDIGCLFLLLQRRWVELMPKSWILVSSDHNTFTQFSELLANFRRAVHVLSWAGGHCWRCMISVLRGVVCYQLFSWWLWSQLPWAHWQDPPV